MGGFQIERALRQIDESLEARREEAIAYFEANEAELRRQLDEYGFAEIRFKDGMTFRLVNEPVAA